jgi:hypothetical protein
MKISMKKYIFLLFLIISALSCKKFVQIPPPKNQLTTATVFADSTGANAAVTGIYINMMQYFNLTPTNGGLTLYTGLSGDELYESVNNTTDAEFYNNARTINNSVDGQFWQLSYQYIYAANACIEGIKSSSGISSTAKNSLTGEAMLIRAFLYFNLVNLYGPVPLVTGTDYSTNSIIGRTDINTIYAQIISDLKFAQSSLSKNTGINARANSYAATALLSKIYLYQAQYAEAITEADKIINSGNFQLETNLNTVFLSQSSETIWSFATVQPGRQTSEGYYFVPSDTISVPTYVITNTLYNSFEPGDKRKSDWISANTVGGQSYPYPYKYKNGSAGGSTVENYVVLRLADQYLIEAEAKANMSDLSGALADLNVIRNRAGLSNFISSDKQTILTAILKERQSEYFCEWGNRWFDLKRTGQANILLSKEKLNWKSTSDLYPIPQTEIASNPKLKQNPGY